MIRRRSCLELVLNFQSMATGQTPAVRDMGRLYRTQQPCGAGMNDHAKARGSKMSLGEHGLERRFCLRRGSEAVQER